MEMAVCRHHSINNPLFLSRCTVIYVFIVEQENGTEPYSEFTPGADR